MGRGRGVLNKNKKLKGKNWGRGRGRGGEPGESGGGTKAVRLSNGICSISFSVTVFKYHIHYLAGSARPTMFPEKTSNHESRVHQSTYG